MVATKFLPHTLGGIEVGTTGRQHIERMINKSLDNLGIKSRKARIGVNGILCSMTWTKGLQF